MESIIITCEICKCTHFSTEYSFVCVKYFNVKNTECKFILNHKNDMQDSFNETFIKQKTIPHKKSTMKSLLK